MNTKRSVSPVPRILRRCAVGSVLGGLLLAGLVMPADAVAQDRPTRDPAAAEALYKAGRDLLAKDDWSGACAKFSASFELDPVASTLINVAKCTERNGRLATAWSELARARALNEDTPGEERKKQLGELIEAQITALLPRVPKLKLVITPRPPDLTVDRDGTRLPPASLEEPIPVDPGQHTVVVSAPGFEPFSRTVDSKEGETLVLEVALAKVGAAAQVPNPPPALERPLPAWPFVTGGAALAMVGAGVAFRFVGFAAEDALDEGCGEERLCDPRGPYDPADDNQQKNFAFGMFVGLTVGGGAAALATVVGLVVELAQPDPSSSALRVLPHPLAQGAMLEVTFR
jgi:hypothetical protein